ncbi:Fic family protein [Burkholderia humptydooensis]|uniref:Fic family protein n=2 Tax=Burkholderia humptydooensis TaxID=430531 RepID=A0A7T2WYC5_9BURK|nr:MULTISPECIES: Fic family protein [Burkholderia]AJY42025.1 fic/DOC family protein [Burkholderia sp. 2002721687]EIP87270.1 Filamentation induced by cAMP protein Fic [Burkholderia humptydooensis MSMB43]QPS44981.1 Fic family protein [Burkholderia humptydooensis]
MSQLEPVGYEHLIRTLRLPVRPLTHPCFISGSVNRRVPAHNGFWFPRSVALEESLVGHLEFALRHESVNLEVIDAVFEHLQEGELARRLSESPNGAPIRRACFLWEWLTGNQLSVEVAPTGSYVDALPDDEYFTAGRPTNNPKFRVRDNLPGTPDFCPLVRRSALPESPTLDGLLDEAADALDRLTDPMLYARAVNYLYLSETRSSFGIEREKPSADKAERFVQSLAHAGEEKLVTENWLVELQNVIVRDVFSQEASYRTKQNWLVDGTQRVTFFPPPPEDLRRVMAGWERFVNEVGLRCPEPLVRAACAAFGFVYLHPFLDGNGRIHRFLIHHVLNGSRRLRGGAIVPVSAVILRHEEDYANVLKGFSVPTTQLWNYFIGDPDPVVTRHPGSRPYRFFDASHEVHFLHAMLVEAVRTELPKELSWLGGYDEAFRQLDAEFDLPQSDLSALIRMVKSNGGKLSANKRKQYFHLPDEVIARIEEVVRESFGNNSFPPMDNSAS